MKRVLMMLGLSGVLLAPLAAQEPSQEKPKTGIVNIQTLFQGYYKTLEAQAQINAERARIQKEDNEMLQRVKVLDQRLRDLTRRLQDVTVGESDRKMIARMEGILDEIRGGIRESAEKGGYDYVFEVGGENTAQVPFLLYAKDGTDITSVIQKELRKKAPAE